MKHKLFSTTLAVALLTGIGLIISSHPLIADSLVSFALKRMVDSKLLIHPKAMGHINNVSRIFPLMMFCYGIVFVTTSILGYWLHRNKFFDRIYWKSPKELPSEATVKINSSDNTGIPVYLEAVFIIFIFAIGLYIRTYFMNQPMRYDEAYTFMRYVNSGLSFLFLYHEPNNHVLHTLWVKLFTSVFGPSPWFIRLPAFLSGVFSIFFVYLASKRLMRGKGGYVSIALMTVLPFMILYSTNARGYSMVVLITLLLIIQGLKLSDSYSFSGCVLFSFLSALGIFTMPSMLLVLPGIFMWTSIMLLINSKNTKSLMTDFVLPYSIMTVVLTFVFYSPVIIASGGIESIIANKYVLPVEWDIFVNGLIPHLQKTAFRFSRDVPLVAVLLVSVLAIGAQTASLIKKDWALFLLLPCILTGCVVVLLLKQKVPFPRTWIFMIPVIFILADAGASMLLERIKVKGAVTLTCILIIGVCFYFSHGLIKNGSILNYPDTGAFPEASIVAEKLNSVMDEKDNLIIDCPDNFPTYYYLWLNKPEAKKIEVNGQKRHEPVDFFVIDTRYVQLKEVTDKPVEEIFNAGKAKIFRTTAGSSLIKN